MSFFHVPFSVLHISLKWAMGLTQPRDRTDRGLCIFPLVVDWSKIPLTNLVILLYNL